MPRCDQCGSHVSTEFSRVFVVEPDQILACPNCTTRAGISETIQRRKRAAEQ